MDTASTWNLNLDLDGGEKIVICFLKMKNKIKIHMTNM